MYVVSTMEGNVNRVFCGTNGTSGATGVGMDYPPRGVARRRSPAAAILVYKLRVVFQSKERPAMRNTIACVAAFALMSAAPALAAETMNGKISDAMCGAKHAEGEHDGKKMTDAECVEACLKHGAKYVFVSGDKVYKIANQDLAGIKANAGKNVTVTGETKGDTITIAKVEAAKPAAK
jgi:uncharacterized protein (DUF2147 family)